MEARAKYESNIRKGSSLAFSYATKCCGRTIEEAVADIEIVVQFHMREWDGSNPKPNNSQARCVPQGGRA